ncbi:hypothetical protein [Olivibacter ginsenosidimutans]
MKPSEQQKTSGDPQKSTKYRLIKILLIIVASVLFLFVLLTAYFIAPAHI